MRLIDVDAFKDDYGMADDCGSCKQNTRKCQHEQIFTRMDFCGWLDDAPTIEIVRCKDCKNAETFNCPAYSAGWFYAGNDYCSNGEAKNAID